MFNERRQERVAAQVELFESLLAALGEAVISSPLAATGPADAESLVKVAEDHALSRNRLPPPCQRPVPGHRGERAHPGVRVQRDHGPDAGGLPDPAQAASGAPGSPGATRGSTTVSAEALNWGFWHFGEFSRAYRDCFGELPSETLRRKPEPPSGRQEAAPPRP